MAQRRTAVIVHHLHNQENQPSLSGTPLSSTHTSLSACSTTITVSSTHTSIVTSPVTFHSACATSSTSTTTLTTTTASLKTSLSRELSVVPNRLSSRSATVDAVVSAMDVHGYCVVENFLLRETAKSIREELNVILRHNPLGRNQFEGFNTKRIYGLFGKTRSFDGPATHPLVLGVLDKTLGPYYQLSSPVGIEIGAHEKAQLLHRDTNKYPLPPGFPEVVVNTMWAIDDFTLENGATVMYPGTHTRARHGFSNPRNLSSWAGKRGGSKGDYMGEAEGTAPLEENVGGPMPGSISAQNAGIDQDPVYGVMPAGSVLFYRGSMLHGGGANRTPTPRLGVILEYAAAWLRPQESHLLVVSPNVVAELPDRLQELLGYNIFPPFVGYVDGRHPKRLLP